ncbi:hypothetical protein KK062_09260 [Fulvivirgaceae bacterium PWU5]|uniref:Uncharacterized protein n=1 Tax=Dawidia cretensis TaxID=2782350 RepID=A0AAP2DW89_9BACT|nr:hypothetical protein [Dawidia cretensis]MBT1708411.1 hypothetical protein [Dawidia cretensis]
MSASIKEIDAIIHRERITQEAKKVMHQRLPSAIPEGTFTLMNEDPYLFSTLGYENSIAVPEASLLTILTPDSIVNAFRAGYAPKIRDAEVGDS